MSTPRHALSNFTPTLRLSLKLDGGLHVFFDSASALDASRAPIAFKLQKWDSMKIEVTGFGVTDVVDSGNMRRISGRVSLVTQGQVVANAESASSERESWVLADLAFNLPALGKRRKDSHFDFTLPSDVHHAVSQGMARAFDLAMSELSDQIVALQPLMAAINLGAVSYVAGGAAAPAPAFLAPPVTGAQQIKRRAATGEPSWFVRNKTLALAVGIPAILALLVVFLLSPAPQTDLDVAVATALEENPAAADAQVRLTKKMLDELNLDPGSAADMGCMAAP